MKPFIFSLFRVCRVTKLHRQSNLSFFDAIIFIKYCVQNKKQYKIVANAVKSNQSGNLVIYISLVW